MFRLFAGLLAVTLSAAPAAAAPQTENVLWVMLDGLRWQEVFTGADEALLNKDRGGVKDVADCKARFWRDTPEARREVLLPFLWGTVAKGGRVYGNKLVGSPGRVTNLFNVSYPGYNEVLCGFPNPLITGNTKLYNPNATVLEWLHGKPGFKDRIAAVTSWDVFPYIINDKRSGIAVNSGFTPLTGLPDAPDLRLLNKLMTETGPDGEETRLDSLTHRAALMVLAAKKPRVLFVSYDETDAHGHGGRYDRLLAAAQKNDRFVRELWDAAQAMPEYRGKTTLVITTDHGRGDAPVGWKNHGAKEAGAEFWWAAVLGPDTPAGGEIRDTPTTQTQVAATVAAALGFDYRKDVPRAGAVLPGAVRP
ncbi:MAG: alkaline phosphatase family protein [Gemmataceae bacterium]